MRILVVGSGAREHALVWKLASEAGVTEVIAAPGNPGIARLARTTGVRAGDVPGLVDLAIRERVDLTVVGPEQPLAAGLADCLAAENRQVFGPTRAASRLESSKAFAKSFMARHAVPTARFRVCESFEEAGRTFESSEFGFPVVVKADGLASGKGVVVAGDQPEAERAAYQALIERRFGDAGGRLVIEECLEGPEVSFFAISDGRTALPLGSAQDHKRVFDDDRGPNTGGMGAFAPSPLIGPELQNRILREIVQPVIDGMRAEGAEYRGFLYVGLILTHEGPKVIEFNVRLGDPEAQVVLPMIDADLVPVLDAAASGSLSGKPLPVLNRPHVGVVLTSAGYPGSFEIGKPIHGLEGWVDDPNVLVFHAGTAVREGRLVTDGGRVLTIVARAATFGDAIDRAYRAVGQISFDGMRYRTDIGRKALPVEA
jgi:phosphoribosylamine--glycine ligase